MAVSACQWTDHAFAGGLALELVCIHVLAMALEPGWAPFFYWHDMDVVFVEVYFQFSLVVLMF